jgi:hypothetical protein
MTYRSRSFIVVCAVAATAAACDGGVPTASSPDARPVLEAGPLSAYRPDGGEVPDAVVIPFDPCTWGLPTGAVTAALTGNNAAEITAPGAGGMADPDLSKVVPVTVTVPSPGLQVVKAWLFRSDASDETAYSAIAVRNVDAAYACFVSIENYHWRSATGAEVLGTGKPHERDYLTGSVGGHPTFTSNTCLGPGETGYFADIRIAGTGALLYSDVASIEFAFRPPSPATPATAKLLVRELQTGSCDSGERRRFRFENTGSDALVTAEIIAGWTLFLDAQGTPTSWNYLGLDKPILLAPGASVLVPVLFAHDMAPGWKAHVFSSFQPAPATATPRAMDRTTVRLLGEIAAARRRLRDDWLRARAGQRE